MIARPIASATIITITLQDAWRRVKSADNGASARKAFDPRSPSDLFGNVFGAKAWALGWTVGSSDLQRRLRSNQTQSLTLESRFTVAESVA